MRSSTRLAGGSGRVNVMQNTLAVVLGLQKAPSPLSYFFPGYQRLGKNNGFKFSFTLMRKKIFNEWLCAVMCQKAERGAKQ